MQHVKVIKKNLFQKNASLLNLKIKIKNKLKSKITTK
jgi:hypothetical protein